MKSKRKLKVDFIMDILTTQSWISIITTELLYSPENNNTILCVDIINNVASTYLFNLDLMGFVLSFMMTSVIRR